MFLVASGLIGDGGVVAFERVGRGASLVKRGVKGERKGKGRGKVGRLKGVRVAPPPPAVVTPTTTVPPVNSVLGEEGVPVKINNKVVPLTNGKESKKK